MWRASFTAVIVVALLLVLNLGLQMTYSKVGVIRGEQVAAPVLPIDPWTAAGYAAAAVIPAIITAMVARAWLDATRLMGIVKPRDFIRHILVFGPNRL